MICFEWAVGVWNGFVFKMYIIVLCKREREREREIHVRVGYMCVLGFVFRLYVVLVRTT